jgi:short-subunit dehydrogenase
MTPSNDAPSRRRALITGASSGLGEALALALARDGYAVWLAARRLDRLEALAGTIRAAGGEAYAVPLDVADGDATARRVVELDQTCGGLDLVIANAGVSSLMRPKHLTWDVARRDLGTNLLGAAATLVPLVPRMLERGRGHLVGISSLAGELAMPLSSQYGAAKAGLTYLLAALRPALRRRGVAVTTVQAGFIRTPMTAGVAFPMPWILEVDRAAELIVRGIHRRKAVIRFPWPLGLAIDIMNLMPRPLREWLLVRGRL